MQQTCDADRIDDFLEDRLSAQERIALENHLEDCSSCQKELHRRAAAPETWREAVELLGDGVSETASDFSDQLSRGRRSRATLSVLDSLSPTDDPEMLGRVGDYEISGVVGIGGMGAVLKGFDRSLRRVVAVKVMSPHLADNGPARARFQREARAAAAITHDNVIDTYGVSESNGLPYLVMPFARGPSLQKRIDESGPLSTIEVVRIGRQIASGLAAAHEQGLVHRDIKPANILLNEGVERLWITDFGVARAMDDASMTQTGVIAGTPQYMSPEQARGETVDQRSDLFSMGSVLYTACTGRPPFRAEAAYGILRRITDTDPRPIREINPEIPEWLCRIIEQLMRKHPGDRCQSAAEVAELLEVCLAHLQQPDQVRLPETLRQLPEAAALRKRRQPDSPRVPGQNDRSPGNRFRLMIVAIVLAGAGFIGLQVTQPAEISGHWAGEQWKDVSLTTVRKSSGWYSGSFTSENGERGVLHLEWSRLQQRYNGRWKLGKEQSGSVTLRVRGDEVRGAATADSSSPSTAGILPLRDFVWRRATPDAKSTEQATARQQVSGTTEIEAPIRGRIVRWGDGISNSAVVRKGDLICELQEIDTTYLERLDAQLSEARRQLDAATTSLVAKEKMHTSAQTIVAALESQQKSYEQVKEQLDAAAEAFVKSAQNRVSAAKAEQEERNAALKVAEAQHKRQATLFEQRIISEVKLQGAEQLIDQAKSQVRESAVALESAKNELEQIENDRKVKQSKSQIDIDRATADLQKAMSDLALAESEVAQVTQERKDAEKRILELQTKVARQQTVQIVAPCSGTLSDMTSHTLLKVGDPVCRIQCSKASQTTKTQPRETRPKVSTTESVVSGQSAVTSSPRRPRPAAWSMTSTIDAACALAGHLRDTRERLRRYDSEQTTEENRRVVERLEKDLAAAQLERETGLAILRAQLEAVRTLLDSQTAVSEQVKRQVETGGLSPISLQQAQQAVVRSAADVRELEILMAYYARLEQDGQTSIDDDRNLFVEVLKVRLDAFRKTSEFRRKQSEITRRLFEQGRTDVDEVLKAEQAEALATAEVLKVEALLSYYQHLKTDGADAVRN